MRVARDRCAKIRELFIDTDRFIFEILSIRVALFFDNLGEWLPAVPLNFRINIAIVTKI